MESAGQMEVTMEGWATLWAERTTTIIKLLGIFEPNKSAPATFDKLQQFAQFLHRYNTVVSAEKKEKTTAVIPSNSQKSKPKNNKDLFKIQVNVQRRTLGLCCFLNNSKNDFFLFQNLKRHQNL